MTLQETASKTARCHVTSAGWMIIKQTFGEAKWEGRVELFELSNPPPKYVYGWTVVSEGKEPVHITLLQSATIDSAPAAVRAWLAGQATG